MGLAEQIKKLFSPKEKLDHYTKIANGQKKVKGDSKFTEAEQIAYARGQRDARNEGIRQYAYKNSTPEQREAYKQKRKEKYKKYKETKK